MGFWEILSIYRRLPGRSWREACDIAFQYDNYIEFTVKMRNEFKPRFSDSFWVEYDVVFDIVDRKKVKNLWLLEQDLSGSISGRSIDTLKIHIYDIVRSNLKRYCVEYLDSPESHLPTFYEIGEFKWCRGDDELKKEDLNLTPTRRDEFWEQVKNNLSTEIFGVMPRLIHVIDYGDVKKKEVLTPETVDGVVSFNSKESSMSDFVENMENLEKYLIAQVVGKPASRQAIDFKELKNEWARLWWFEKTGANAFTREYIERLELKIKEKEAEEKLRSFEANKNKQKLKDIYDIKQTIANIMDLEVGKNKIMYQESEEDTAIKQLQKELKRKEAQREAENKEKKQTVIGEFVQGVEIFKEIEDEYNSQKQKITGGKPPSKLTKEEKRAVEILDKAKKTVINRLGES